MTAQPFGSIDALVEASEGLITIDDDRVGIADQDAIRGDYIDRLVRTATFSEGDLQASARWLIRSIAESLDAYPASINDVYLAAGDGAYQNITTPAINVRTLTYDVARTIFRAAKDTHSASFIFEIARSEMGYSAQRPADYAAAVLAAAIKEEYRGPVFIQGDHFQASAKAFAADPAKEINAVKDLATEAMDAGFFNIDIDASTLVDIDEEDLAVQQRNNYEQTAEILEHIRAHQPYGLDVSVGAEIGEVGKRNSTVEDFNAFMGGFEAELKRRSAGTGHRLTGISKISVQTGTSHGGTVLPDGSIKEVSVDFDVLAAISKEGRRRYHIGGAVQHGASTLAEEAFSKFAEANAIEVHLATAFQNAILDSEHFPDELRDRMYKWIDENRAGERKPDQTDAQFYYSERKRAFGPFKRDIWDLPDEARDAIMAELQPRFARIMHELRVAGQEAIVARYISPIAVTRAAPTALTGVTA